MKTKEEIIEYVYGMNLQNLTEKVSFDRAYKKGIEDTVNDLIELNLLTIPIVVKSFYCETKRCKEDGSGQCIECALFELNKEQ